MRKMINYALVFLCLPILSCCSYESSEEIKYIEIIEPENTKKIIETRYYDTMGEIDGDYIPGEEFRALLIWPTKDFYGFDDKILMSIVDLGYIRQKHVLTVTNYSYDSNHQLDNITEISVLRSDEGWTGIVELSDTTANLTFKRNNLGLLTEIAGFGSTTLGDKSYRVTKFIYNEDGKLVKEIYDSLKYKTYQYFSLLNGYTVVKCDEYGEQVELTYPSYQGKVSSLTEIYNNGQKIKALEQMYRYGHLISDKETTFMCDDKNRLIQIVEKEAFNLGFHNPDDTYEDYMNRGFKLQAQYIDIIGFQYDNKGNPVYFKKETRVPGDNEFLRIGNNTYYYVKSASHAYTYLNQESTYYYNEYGDWYKQHMHCPGMTNAIVIRTIEYRE